MASSQWRKQLGVIAFMFVVATCLAQDPPYRQITVKDGLPSNTVYAAIRAQDGYMWFGTDAGAIRFDGARFTNYTTNDGLGDNEVLGLFQDSKGRIWFQTLNSRVSYFQNGRIHNAREHPEFDSLRFFSGINSSGEDRSGRIWFTGSVSGLCSWYEGRVRSFQPTELSNGQPAAGKGRLFNLADGRLRLSVGGTIYDLDSGTPVCCGQWRISAAGHPLVNSSAGRVVGLGADGIMHFDGDEPTVLIPADPRDEPQNWRLPMRCSDGTVLVPLNSGGVVGFMPEDRSFRRERWFRWANINSICETADGDLWYCTDGQGMILCARGQREVRLFKPTSGSMGHGVSSVLVLRNGDVLFGTDNGEMHTYRNGFSERLAGPIDGTNIRDHVRQIAQAPDGTVWFAMDGEFGILHMGAGHAEAVCIPQRDERAPASVRQCGGMKALAIGHDGKVIASFFGIHVLVHEREGALMLATREIWPEPQRMYAPFIAQDGRIWFETDDELHVWDGSSHRDFPGFKGRFGSRITDIDELSDGTLVVATAGRGIALVRGDSIVRSIARAHGLSSDQVRVARVKNDVIWTATDAGSDRVIDPLGTMAIRTWDRTSGAPSNDVKDVDADAHNLYLATPEGLCVISLSDNREVPRVPQLLLEEAMMNDSIVEREGPFILRMGDRLAFRFLAIDHRSPSELRFAMRLLPDTTWHTTGSTVQLNSLQPGEYRLQMRAAVGVGAWSKPLAFGIEVEPPWYRALWFRGMSVVFLVGMGLLAAGHLTKRQVRRRTAEVAAQLAMQEERQRIAADVHDELGADLSHLLMLARQCAAEPQLDDWSRRSLRAIEEHSANVVRKIDEIIWSLDPHDDTWLSTLRFIQRSVEEIAGRDGLAFRTATVATGSDAVLRSTARRELYLMVKEMVTNLLKHGGCSVIHFGAELRNDRALIELAHDGKAPFTETNGSGRKGHGLNNIRARAMRLGACIRDPELVEGLWRTRIEVPFIDPAELRDPTTH